MTRRLVVFLLVSVAVIACDQILKSWSRAHLLPMERRPLLGQSQIVLSHYESTPKHSPWLPVAVWCLILARVGWRQLRARMPETIAFAMLLAGGLSNILERFRTGSILDPLQFALGGNRYLPFNLADLALSLGGLAVVLILLMEMVFRRRIVTKSS